MRRSFYERPALFFGVVFFGFIALSFVVAVGPAIEIQAKHKPLPGSQPMTPQELRGFDVYITVFVPTTPNPTSGFMLFVPEADVRILKMSVEDAVKTIFSGGMLGPARMEYRSAPLQHMGPAREGELPSA